MAPHDKQSRECEYAVATHCELYARQKRNYDRFCLKSQDPLLDTVSTTCDSRWVAAVRRLASSRGPKAAHPPATAGGTDPIQVATTDF